MKNLTFFVSEIEKRTRLHNGSAALKAQAHYYFDLLWRRGFMTRKQSYYWLSRLLDCSENEAHISSMSKSKLIATIYHCIKFQNTIGNEKLDRSDFKDVVYFLDKNGIVDSLYHANPYCNHEVVPGANYSGVICNKCSGWFCY